MSSADRELSLDEDTAALLLFYAAECAIKSVYLNRHQLAHTADENSRAKSARSFKHNIGGLIQQLQVAASAVGQIPPAMLKRTEALLGHQDLHQAWRYGERIHDMALITSWLRSVVEWARQAV